MMNTKSKVAIYCRLSEEDRNKQSETDDSNSIQNQKSMLLQYSLEHGWEVYNIYSDDDYTGSDRRRPEFNRLLEDAKNRKFDMVFFLFGVFASSALLIMQIPLIKEIRNQDRLTVW